MWVNQSCYLLVNSYNQAQSSELGSWFSWLTLQLLSVSLTRLLLQQVSVTTDVASPTLGLHSEPLLCPALQKEPPGCLDPLPLGGEVWSRWVMNPAFPPALPGEGAVDKGWAGRSPLGDRGTSCAISPWVSSTVGDCCMWARAGPTPHRRD